MTEAAKAPKKPYSWKTYFYETIYAHSTSNAFHSALLKANRLSILNNNREVIVLKNNAQFEVGFEPETLLGLPSRAEIFARVTGWEVKYE